MYIGLKLYAQTGITNVKLQYRVKLSSKFCFKMSRGSDWLNLFVHQGKEFIDSVSGPKKEGVSSSESQQEVSNSATKVGVSFSNSLDGSINFEGNDNSSGLKAEQSTSMAAEASSSPSVEKTTLTQGEKEIYENQLEQLQEQLVDIMIKNQEMETELSLLRESDVCKLTKELDREKIKRKQLEVKLKKVKEEQHNTTPKLRRRKRPDGSLEQDRQSTSADQQTTNNTDVVNKNQYEVPKGEQSRVSRFKFWAYSLYVSLTQRIVLTFWNIVSDLSDEETAGEAIDEDVPPLAVKTLKDNINRFSNGIKPIKEFINKITWVLSWKNPAATMLIFMVYVFSFWHGFIVSLLLFLAIVQLSANFVYSRFGSISSKQETETTAEQARWSDKFQVVLHVARRVQNILGNLSDYLEKVKNLLIWKVYHVTLKLYIVLWLLFISSIFLNGPQFVLLLGILLGCKLFVISPVYNRFPKLKKRYDSTYHLWLELPTDCEVGIEDVDYETSSSSSHQPSVGMLSDISVTNSRLFCERYKLTSDEIFVKGWEDGWRTSLLDKLRPLVNPKHGRLYLTQNYLCFERSRTNLSKNILIKLSDIRSVKKYKPFYLLPGTGMSIEVSMKDKNELPYIFGAMIGRDDAYNDIIQAGRNADLSWAK